jgi:acyl transferase domain-containing protein
MATMNENQTMPIAVVGLGCRFPGDATNPEKFWNMLLARKSAMTETPPDRYNIDAFYHPDGSRNGTVSSLRTKLREDKDISDCAQANNRGGHFLKDDISAFDAGFFSISAAEAISMDPMQRMLLEIVYEATENAGIPISDLAGSNTGVFVGCWANDYDTMAKRDAEVLPKYHTLGTGQAILSNRVSFCFDLKGPSLTIDTACRLVFSAFPSSPDPFLSSTTRQCERERN